MVLGGAVLVGVAVVATTGVVVVEGTGGGAVWSRDGGRSSAMWWTRPW